MHKRFAKSVDNRKVFGVCGGLAQGFGVDSNVIRVVFVVLFVVTRGFFIWVYLLLGLLLPTSQNGAQRPDARPLEEWKQQWKQEAQDVDYTEEQTDKVSLDKDKK